MQASGSCPILSFAPFSFLHPLIHSLRNYFIVCSGSDIYLLLNVIVTYALQSRNTTANLTFPCCAVQCLQTALLGACRLYGVRDSGDKVQHLVQMLIEAGADVNHRDNVRLIEK